MKTIAITGTSSGIGKAIAEFYKKKKWKTIELNLPEFDVRNLEHIISYNFPKLDVFINNAGIMPLVSYEKTTPEIWDDIINTNLRGPFFLCQKVIPKIKNEGCLINIASTGGIEPEKELVAYCISKSGLIMLTKCLHKCYGDRIRINSISPGVINTNIAQGKPVPYRLVNKIPIKKVANPDVIVSTVDYIVNNYYVRGENIKVDGGMLG